jgi:TolB-like protein
MTAVERTSPIELAEEAPFALSGAEVRPATLEVIAGERRELLEPRVMQVLVALARRRGEIVSRDDLIEQCWGGRIVGEDAITRALAQLRKLAKSIGGFEIETVPRVGVRLVEAEPAVRGPVRHRLAARIVAGMLLAALLVVGAVWAWRFMLVVGADEEPAIAVREFQVIGSDARSRTFATALADEITGVLGEKAVGFAIQGPRSSQVGAAGLLLHGTVAQDDGVWRVRVYLDDRRSNLTVWSRQFERPSQEEQALRDQVAVAVTDVAYFARLPLTQDGLRLDPQTLALFIAAMWELSNPRDLADPRIRRLFEQVAAREPGFAWARGAISRNLHDASLSAPPEQRGDLRRRARAEAEAAIRLNPRAVDPAYDTLYMLARTEAPGDLAAAEDRLLGGIAASAEGPWLHMRECRFLVEVGRAADALRHCEKARALRPLNGVIDASFAWALYAAGRPTDAVQAAAEAARLHPNHLLCQQTNVVLAVYQDAPARARELMWGPAKKPVAKNDAIGRVADLLLRARETGTSIDVERAVAAGWAATSSGRFGMQDQALVAASLGRADAAFRALEMSAPGEAPQAAGVAQPTMLLDPRSASMWRDPRFWSYAARAGYVRYWRTRDKWPDFCNDPNYPLDCRAEAARLAHIEPDR